MISGQLVSGQLVSGQLVSDLFQWLIGQRSGQVRSHRSMVTDHQSTVNRSASARFSKPG